jgi:hypothetical protein
MQQHVVDSEDAVPNVDSEDAVPNVDSEDAVQQHVAEREAALQLALVNSKVAEQQTIEHFEYAPPVQLPDDDDNEYMN